VDLGYVATVGSVALAGAGSTPAGAVRMYVRQTLDEPLSDDRTCTPGTVPLPAAGWAVSACNITGR
jgi:hypothetical protein